MIVFAQAILVRGQTLCFPKHTPVWTSVLLVQQGLGSSREAKHEEQIFWVEQAATRGYNSYYDDRSRQWKDGKPSGSTNDNECNQGCDVPLRTMLWASRRHPRPVILEWRWQRRRTLYDRGWELHRLLNYLKGSLRATYKKNAEANNRAYDMNQKTTTALDTLVEEYGVFEVTMQKVTFEHEEGDVLYAVASEVAEELDWAHEDQDRPVDELEWSNEDLATAFKEFSTCWATHEASTKVSSAVREVSDRRATHEAICAEVRTACHETSELKLNATEVQENMISHK